MNGLSSSPLNLVYIILLFVPGLVGLDLYLRSSQLVGRFNRLQLLAYSIGLSLVSLGFLYFLTPFYLDYFVADVPPSPLDSQLATVDQLSQLTLPDIVALYILHVLSAITLGTTAGFFDREVLNHDEERDRREPWAYTFDEAAFSPEDVQVHLSGEDVIEGKWHRKTWSEDVRELYLREPSKVRFGENGKETEPLGRGIYIHVDEISRVVLPNIDPQTDPEESEVPDEDSAEESLTTGPSESLSDQPRSELPEGLSDVPPDVFDELREISDELNEYETTPENDDTEDDEENSGPNPES